MKYWTRTVCCKMFVSIKVLALLAQKIFPAVVTLLSPFLQGCRRISRNFIHNSGQSRRVMLTLCRTFIIYDRFVLIEAQLHVESNIAAFFSCILSDEVRGLPIILLGIVRYM